MLGGSGNGEPMAANRIKGVRCALCWNVDDIDAMLARLNKRGAQLVGEMVQYEDAYRLCYIRSPDGLLIGLAEEFG